MKHIEAKGIYKTFVNKYNENEVLEDITFSIDKGEFVSLIGRSGCGKTTLLRIIAGFEKVAVGEVICDGIRVLKPNMKRAYIFQDFNQLFPWKTVKENIMYPLLLSKYGNRKECAKRADEYLELIELKEYAASYPHSLSGGMKQRVALGRALAMQPEIILMDEPFSAVDAQTRQHLHEELVAIWKKIKPTIIFVTHNIDEAIHLSTRVLVLNGKPAKIIEFVNNVSGNKKPNDVGYSEFWNTLFMSIE